MEKVFCDETGFTGPDLLNPDQQFFGYASVRIAPQRAEEILAEIRTRFPLQMPEWKGSKMLSTRRGREAALAVFDAVCTQSITVVADKRFALAGKLFEYIFEPVLYSVSEPLYQRGFHKFIANLLYLHLRANQAPVDNLLSAFQDGVRKNDFSVITNALAPPGAGTGAEEFANLITKFCVSQGGLIEAEIAKVGIPLLDKWGLDLTSTCLTGLLGLWADRNVPLDLILDDSKPLLDWWDAVRNLYEIRPGPSGPGQYITIEGRRSRVQFSLSCTPLFGSSKVTAGLQIADVVAAVVSDAFQHRDRPENQDLLIRANQAQAIDPNCIFPDLNYIDPKRPLVRANQALLWGIMDRAFRGVSVVAGFEQLLHSPGIRL